MSGRRANKFMGNNSIVPVMCADCRQEFDAEVCQVGFRFGDIEASLQYNPSKRKKSMDEQEEEME